jgi:hypothetical protein
MDYRQYPSDQWLDYFRAAGHPLVRPIGGGVEGAIYRLRPGVVAKVWAKRRIADLEMYAQFYSDLRSHHELPFDTPLIRSVRLVNGLTITEENELRGHPLQDGFENDAVISERYANNFVDILTALRDVPWFSSAKDLSVLGEDRPLMAGEESWPRALAALISRKYRQYQHLLTRDVNRVEGLVQDLIGAVGRFDVAPVGIVHGDLFGANVLVDDQLQVSAVLDFGFMTCAGDPDLDAAIVSLIADQYGSKARQSEQIMDDLLVERLDLDRQKLLTYKAVYALVTSGFFSEDGSDGHYPWCVGILNRREIREAVRSG